MRRTAYAFDGDTEERRSFRMRFRIGKLVLAVIALIVLFDTFITVDADEVAVITRFDKFDRTVEPGLHLMIPFVENENKVKVGRVHKEEFGFRTEKADVKSEYSDNIPEESDMITGDLNISLVEWIVQYRVKDPVAYTFRVRNVVQTLRHVSMSAMRQVVGDHSVDEVIIADRQAIAMEVRRHMQHNLDLYGSGIEIIAVNLQDVNPPKEVQESFNSVNGAKQEKEKMINNALMAYNKAIPQAEGEAKQTIGFAEGYAIERTNKAIGDATAFRNILAEYNRSPMVTSRRLYLETMDEIIRGTKVIIMDGNIGGNVLPLLQLNREEKND